MVTPENLPMSDTIRMSRLYLGIYMSTHIHLCMEEKLNEIGGYEFESARSVNCESLGGKEGANGVITL